MNKLDALSLAEKVARDSASGTIRVSANLSPHTNKNEALS